MNALIRGFNCPIVLLLESDLTDVSDFHAQLTFAAGEMLQEWDIDSAVIEKNTVILPVKQAESLTYPAGRALVTAEWSVSGKPKGGTQPTPILIVDYPDKSILGSDETVTEYSATIAAADLPDPWEFTADQLRTAAVVKVSGSSYDDTELRQLIAAEGTARSSADSAEAAARAEADAGKANAAEVYTKTEADALLAKKSNAANVYSKAAADALLAGKADTEHTHTVSQITDFPAIPEGWTELVYGTATADDIAAVWPECYLSSDTDTHDIAFPSYFRETPLTYCFANTQGLLHRTYIFSYNSWGKNRYTAPNSGNMKSIAFSGSSEDAAYDSTAESHTAGSIAEAVAGKADASHTHTVSQITDFPTIPTLSNDFTDTYKEEVDTLWEDYRTALTLIGGES